MIAFFIDSPPPHLKQANYNPIYIIVNGRPALGDYIRPRCGKCSPEKTSALTAARQKSKIPPRVYNERRGTSKLAYKGR